MFDARKILGRTGEKDATRFLKKKGCRIIQENYRNKMGEIDIIVRDGDVIVFVEVKTRQADGPVSPKEAVTSIKQKTIVKVAAAWLKEKKMMESRARFDVISILSSRSGKHIEWIKNAFRA